MYKDQSDKNSSRNQMKKIVIIVFSLVVAFVAYKSYSQLITKKSAGQIDFSNLSVEQTMKIFHCESGNDCLMDRYTACTKSDECVLVKGPCGWDMRAVNKQYEADANAYFAHEGTMIDCADKPSDWQNPNMAVCKLNKCAMP
jgi:hypothetical protein